VNRIGQSPSAFSIVSRRKGRRTDPSLSDAHGEFESPMLGGGRLLRRRDAASSPSARASTLRRTDEGSGAASVHFLGEIVLK